MLSPRPTRLAASLFLLLAAVVLPEALAAQEAARAKIAEAMRAGPASVTDDATVIDWDQNVLREGDSRWTCLPAMPEAERPNPMCLDDPWLQWLEAFQNGTDPEVSGLGISYMLGGDAPVNNADPTDQTEDPGEVWVESGPHIMVVVPDASLLEGIPTDPSAGGPWVMWKGTPYAHIMIPTTDRVRVR